MNLKKKWKTMTKTIKDFRTQFERIKGRFIQVSEQIEETHRNIRIQTKVLHQHEQARELIREAGLKTQQQLQYHISDITSLALDAVFEDPYELIVEFVQRRNRTECDLYFQRNGERADPLTASGGGAVDIASFALRIASWTMMQPRSRSTIILDEPLKNLDKERQERGSQMLKEISDRLGIQFLIVTHEPTLTSFADRVFEVTQRKGVSRIKQLS
jgi:DNA repair exonuclease SbcCD ATPase subunit